jgi:hypothetical protein
MTIDLPNLRVVQRERGATLLVGLILLVLLTLHGIAAFHAGLMQLRATGDLQSRRQAESAADLAVGVAIGSAGFADNPTAATQTHAIDVDGDSRPDFDVTVSVQCQSRRPMPPRLIDPDSGESTACVAGTAFDGSLCMLTQWDVQAVAIPAAGAPATGARSEVHQGVTLPLPAGMALESC